MVLPLTTRQFPGLVNIRGKSYIFSNTDGVYCWNGEHAVPADSELSWATGKQIANVRELSDGSLFASTSSGMLHVIGGQAKPVLQSAFEIVKNQLFIDALKFGDTCIVASNAGGLAAYSWTTEKPLWTIPPDAIGGRIYSIADCDDYLLVGTTSSIFAIPHPNYISSIELPEGDNEFITELDGRTILATTSGAYYLDTLEKCSLPTFPPGTPGRTYTLAKTPSGVLLQGGLARIMANEKVIRLKGRNVHSLVPIDDTQWFIAQPHGLSIVTADGDIQSVELDASVDSIARIDSGEFLVGTSQGFIVLGAGAEIRKRFGTEASRVYTSAGHTYGIDASGRIYSGAGDIIIQLPGQTSVHAVMWRDKLCVLFRNQDGGRWVAVVDPVLRTWSALNVPAPVQSARLANIDGTLAIVSYKVLIKVIEAKLLIGSDFRNVRVAGLASARSNNVIEIPTTRSSLTLELPLPRLRPWSVPSYQIQLNGDAVINGQRGGTVEIPRLPFGRSNIAITETVAGIKETLVIPIDRLRPWWVSWPGLTAYGGIFGAICYWVVKLQTRRLERRASMLERKVDQRTTELRKAQKTREEFFSTLSHEIRNPLNGVVGLCEILNRPDASKDPERQKTLLRTLQGCSDQLRSIIDDVLDFTRIDRGEILLQREPFEINSAIEGSIRIVDTELARTTMDALPEPIWLMGDEGKVRQIVTNLVSNALKYGVPKQAHVHVDAAAGSEGLTKISISVVNTGPTIPADELELIFSGFVRGSDASKRRIPGTGLGLAVSRCMAVAMGGTLEATSADNLTEFRFQVSLQTTSPAAATPPSVAKIVPHKRILVVEDEPYNRIVLEHLLKDLGQQADWASDGASALEKVRSENYDLVLMDIALPDTTGFELAKKVREQRPLHPPVIIAVTAYCTPEKLTEAHSAGILTVLTKPISEKKLFEIVGSSQCPQKPNS